MSFPDLLKIPKIDKLGVQEIVNRFCKRSIKTSAKKHGLHLALSMIDLTTLEGKDTTDKVRRLCYKASHLHNSLQGLPNVAAVCVYPTLVRVAKKELEGTKINVASVATAFPSGQSTLDVKLSDTKFAVNEGADEVDMVISRGKFLAGEYNFVYDEIAAEEAGISVETKQRLYLIKLLRRNCFKFCLCYDSADFVSKALKRFKLKIKVKLGTVMIFLW